MTDSLTDAIAAFEAATGNAFGPHNERMAAFLTRSGQADRRRQPGEAAPGFALPNAQGTLRRLGDLLDRRGLVLVFVRGLWCPYCTAQMTAFQKARLAFDAIGLRVAIVTPEIGGRAAETRAALSLTCEVLCDVDGGTALNYGCLFPVPSEDQAWLRARGYDLPRLYGNEAWLMPLASTFLIGADGIVRAVLGGADQRCRSDPAEIVVAAEALLDPGAGRDHSAPA